MALHLNVPSHKPIMERRSRLADLTLVTKYFPVANYSYPQSATPHSTTSSHFFSDRSSLGSEASAPGLVEDHAESDVSGDDDYQYHAHGAELWDSFWQAGYAGAEEMKIRDHQRQKQLELHPAEQYPALIPSPHRKKPQPTIGNSRPSPSWPLPNSAPQVCTRRAAATYSPFPKPMVIPTQLRVPSPSTNRDSVPISPRTVNPVRPASPSKPQRPARPDNRLLTPCIQQTAAGPVAFATTTDAAAQLTFRRRPSAPLFEHHRPAMSLDHQRPSKSLDHGSPTRPMRSSNPIYASPVASLSATRLCRIEEPKTKIRTPRSYKSSPHMAADAAAAPMATRPEEPHSVFEEDSDSDTETHGLSFFRFHKRSDSDNSRRTTKGPDHDAVSSGPTSRGKRDRAFTAPSSPPRQQPVRQQEAPVRKRAGGDVLGRMLGRRSKA